ncbi:MAG: hypothetical protein E7158_00725 [Firmicutes bacterium]|nr:hypothetical protein [Bacillota bacterium]
MKLIAHRGIWHNKDEQNTLKAINKTINNNNYIGFECDVRKTSDNNYIINHDAIYKNKLISKHPKKYFKKNNILFLDDVLKINTDKIKLIEIKDSNIDIESINKKLNSNSNNLYVMSFHNKVIESLYNKEHTYKLGVLNYIINSEKEYKYDFVCLLDRITSKNVLNKYSQTNIEVFIYGILDGKLKYNNNVFYIINDNILKK